MKKRNFKKEEASEKVLSAEEWKIKLENYCAYRERCEQEVRQKMYEWKISEEEREEYVSHLKENGFLNEDRFVHAFARGKFRIKHWGKNKIMAELRAKNIKDKQIQESVKEIDEGEYFLSLVDLLEKKDKTIKEADLFKRKQKLFTFAMQKGYEVELIKEALKSLKS